MKTHIDSTVAVTRSFEVRLLRLSRVCCGSKVVQSDFGTTTRRIAMLLL